MRLSSPSFFTPAESLSCVRVIPLGGCGEFGMNLTCYLISGRLIVVDCGVKFSDPGKLGTEALIPAVDSWFRQADGVSAYFITHAHEDHLGGLPYLLQRWPAPIYTTRWTVEILKEKLVKHGLSETSFQITCVAPGDIVQGVNFQAEWIHLNHSIPDACAIFFTTPCGNIFHTGDFKFEDQPLIEAPMSVPRLLAIADQGVDLLFADSTNADKLGGCPEESSVYQPLLSCFQKSPKAVIISTFASNLWRLKTIADVCQKTGRRLWITGPGIEMTLNVAKRLGIYELPKNLRVNEEDLGTISRDQLCILASGCQGEPRSSLSRIARREYRAFNIEEDDTVILSSRVIPGNEKPIFAMMDALRRQGAQVITPSDAPGIHVSGHAYREDLSRLIRLLRPKYLAPVHGTFTHLFRHQRLGIELGISRDRCFLIENGDVLTLENRLVTKESSDRSLSIAVEYIDRDSFALLSHDTLRERLRIGELGALLVSGVYDYSRKVWVFPLDFEFLGIEFPLQSPKERWIAAQKSSIEREIEFWPDSVSFSKQELTEHLRVELRRSLFSVLKKKPVVKIKIFFL